jgi:hypothetical protein
MIDESRRRCVHIERGTFAKHSDFRLVTVSTEHNTTSYAWCFELELCVLCAGIARGALSTMLQVANGQDPT